MTDPAGQQTARNERQISPTAPGDLRYWLALHHAPGVGVAAFHQLLQQFGSPQAAFESGAGAFSTGRWRRQTLDYLAAPDWQAVDAELAWARQPDNHVITFRDPRYPALLREIADPPPLLYLHGNPAALSALQLAIVGSRNPTPGGVDTAHDFARFLAGAGLAICSGLALGVDAASHRGALAGGGMTIAVMGTGLDRVYPARHRDLAHQIANNGALVSEFRLGTAPRPENFPRRNRLISGLSLGTLVIEAGISSGSLVTARLAAEQGREVFAIPGSIHNPLAKGCHLLIRQGAKLVENAGDVLEELGPLAGVAAANLPRQDVVEPTPEFSGPENIVLKHLGFEALSIDTLVAKSGMAPEIVSASLVALELLGQVSSAAGGRYCRVHKSR
ncbi:MAG: DNA processing protein [Gammaproteobacteria bacterium]|nr:MAG: DNA processing protein [Gammaproteobacteria bacterium]TND04039.1 MAG: DNA processing protein [Gammaproteobacteria bacterium]